MVKCGRAETEGSTKLDLHVKCAAEHLGDNLIVCSSAGTVKELFRNPPYLRSPKLSAQFLYYFWIFTLKNRNGKTFRLDSFPVFIAPRKISP